jgi:hypothetical protein
MWAGCHFCESVLERSRGKTAATEFKKSNRRVKPVKTCRMILGSGTLWCFQSGKESRIFEVLQMSVLQNCSPAEEDLQKKSLGWSVKRGKRAGFCKMRLRSGLEKVLSIGLYYKRFRTFDALQMSMLRD